MQLVFESVFWFLNHVITDGIWKSRLLFLKCFINIPIYVHLAGLYKRTIYSIILRIRFSVKVVCSCCFNFKMKSMNEFSEGILNEKLISFLWFFCTVSISPMKQSYCPKSNTMTTFTTMNNSCVNVNSASFADAMPNPPVRRKSRGVFLDGTMPRLGPYAKTRSATMSSCTLS